MILQYLFVILLLAQSGQQQPPAAQPPTPPAPQTGVGEAVQPQDAVSKAYILLCNDAERARQTLDGGMEDYRRAVEETCRAERLERLRDWDKGPLPLLERYYQRRRDCLETLVKHQRQVLGALENLRPPTVASPVDIDLVRKDLANAEERKNVLETRLAAATDPDEKRNLRLAIEAEQRFIDTLRETIAHYEEDRRLREKALRDWEEAVKLQMTYLKNEEAGLDKLKQEVSMLRAVIEGAVASRILVCAEQEGR